MGLWDGIVKMFVKKPKNLGEGLARVKKYFGAVGEDLAKTPGKRLYTTPCGNKVKIDSSRNLLTIDKTIEDGALRAYKATPAGILRNYFNYPLSGDKLVALNRSTTLEKFGSVNKQGELLIKRTTYNNRRVLPYDRVTSMGIKV